MEDDVNEPSPHNEVDSEEREDVSSDDPLFFANKSEPRRATMICNIFSADREQPELPASPEKNLFASVLERAILDLKLDDTENFRTARRWIFSNSQVDFSFFWVMSVLGLDHSIEAVRRRAARLVKLAELRNADQFKKKRVIGREGLFEILEVEGA